MVADAPSNALAVRRSVTRLSSVASASTARLPGRLLAGEPSRMNPRSPSLVGQQAAQRRAGTRSLSPDRPSLSESDRFARTGRQSMTRKPPVPGAQTPRRPATALRAKSMQVRSARAPRCESLPDSPSFTLLVRSLSGDVLATLPGAKGSWTRRELLSALAPTAPAPVGKSYRFIFGDRMLAGGLMLRDLGLAPGISSNGVVGIELNAIVMENEALPVFAEARDCLQCIDRRDIVEVRAMRTPPNTVLYVVEAIGCVLGEQRGRAWENTKEILKSPQTLLEKLIGFDPDDDAVRICHVLGPYIESDFFDPERVLRASRACGALCQWCHALHTYCRFAEATGLA